MFGPDRGFRAPVNVTLFHADWENNGPIIASPSRSRSAVAALQGSVGEGGSRIPAVGRGVPPRRRPGRAPEITAEQQADHDQAKERGRLGESERVLDPLTQLQAPHIDRGQEHDQCHRN